MAVERFEVGKTYCCNGMTITPTLVGSPIVESYSVHQYAEWTTDGRLDRGFMEPQWWSEVTTYPELWINVYSHGLTYHASREDADAAAQPRRIGVLHLHTDGTTTMEAP